jgi:DNA polymerase III epsilon subunit-like protein
MNYFYLCIKTVFDPTKGLSISDFKGDSAAYCQVTSAKVLAYAAGVGPIETIDLTVAPADEVERKKLIQGLRGMADDPDWTVVAHHAEFAVAAWKYCLGLPMLQRVLCTENLARVRGLRLKSFSLAGCSKYFDLPPRIAHNPAEGHHHMDELLAAAYRDVELCRALHRKLVELP